MPTGKIQSLVAEKGFGFIKPATGDDVFFHCSAVDVEFKSLTVGQHVEYELDPSTEKLRAKSVKAGAAGSSPSDRAGKPYDRRPAARPKVNYKYGFVVKLRKRDQQGSISTEEGGPEFWFDSVDVDGEKGFQKLAMGEYVQFIPVENQDDPKRPLAKSVRVADRRISKQENRLPRQTRARGKKPTWRK